MVKLEAVEKSYSGELVIPSLTLELSERKTHVLLGPSGCGKTTILRMICGLTIPEQGNIFIQDRRVKEIRHKEIARLFGYVIQDGGLLPHLNVRQNICFPVLMQQSWESADESRLMELLEMVHLSESLLDQYPQNLSGGQRQRVSLLRGLIMDAPLLLLDEPMSALDPLVRLHLQSELKEIIQRFNKTVVMVTHDIHEAARLADQVYLLKDGKVIQKGKFNDFLNNPASDFVAEFVKAQLPLEELSS